MAQASNTRFIELLKRFREAKDLSPAALSRRANLFGRISRSYLSRIEQGTRTPSRETVLVLAKALELTDKETNALLAAAEHRASSPNDKSIPALQNPAVIELLEFLGDQNIPPRKRLRGEEQLIAYIKFLRAELAKTPDKPESLRKKR